VFDPVPCFPQPVFVCRSIDVALVLKDPGVFGQPHKLDCRDGVVQDDAGALHATAAIHRLALDHYLLGLDWERSQRSHIDDYAEWSLRPRQRLLTLLIPPLEFSFRHLTTEGEMKSQIDLLYFVHMSTPARVRP